MVVTVVVMTFMTVTFVVVVVIMIVLTVVVLAVIVYTALLPSRRMRVSLRTGRGCTRSRLVGEIAGRPVILLNIHGDLSQFTSDRSGRRQSIHQRPGCARHCW